MNTVPSVSIVMITYAHESYIQQAITGVLEQECDFEIELIVSNDCSPDKTNSIVHQIIKTHPKSYFVKYTNHRKTKGMIPNFIWALKQAKGKYLAFCEGDDYWTDPLKLQKQVDFLEKNPDYNICFHKVQLYNQKDQIFTNDTITRQVPDSTDMTELAKGNYIHTPSVLLRNNFSLPNWFSKVPVGDWSLYMIAVKDKKIKKLEDTMAVYRVNEEGVWSGKTRLDRMLMTINTFKLAYKNLEIESASKKKLSNTISELKKVINLHRGGIHSLKYRVYNFYKNYLKLK